MLKTATRPQKRTLISLMSKHREDAKRATNKVSKEIHWEFAFTYLNMLRAYYSPENLIREIHEYRKMEEA